jgi:hypothetical protein
MHDPILRSEMCSNAGNLPLTSKIDVESIRYTCDANTWTAAFHLAR